MVNKGLLVRLEAKPGKDAEIEGFLRAALPLVRDEPGTTAWFAARFGRSEYGIVDVFADEAGRAAHLAGPIARALLDRADALFEQPPRFQTFDVLAEKLPVSVPTRPVAKALLLTFEARPGCEETVEQFLRDARPIVEEEPKTTAWFAIHLDNGEYGIFDVFPDGGGRFAHLTGYVPRALAERALVLLGSVPDMEMIHVLADKLPTWRPPPPSRKAS